MVPSLLIYAQEAQEEDPQDTDDTDLSISDMLDFGIYIPPKMISSESYRGMLVVITPTLQDLSVSFASYNNSVEIPDTAIIPRGQNQIIFPIKPLKFVDDTVTFTSKNYILRVFIQFMENDPHSDEEIQKILTLKKVAVIGMSKHPSKAAHYVPKYLSDNGYDVIPVNPTTDEILGKKSYYSVSEIDDKIDIVDVFRPSDQILPVIEEAIKKKPKVIWLQEGIHNPDAEELAKKAGIDVVFNRCMLAEHQRLAR